MKRILTPLVLLAFAGSLTLAGCAKKEETSGTTTDSTLSLGDLPPETSPAPGATYTPGTLFHAPKGVPHGPHVAKTEVISLTMFDGALRMASARSKLRKTHP